MVPSRGKKLAGATFLANRTRHDAEAEAALEAECYAEELAKARADLKTMIQNSTFMEGMISILSAGDRLETTKYATKMDIASEDRPETEEYDADIKDFTTDVETKINENQEQGIHPDVVADVATVRGLNLVSRICRLE